MAQLQTNNTAAPGMGAHPNDTDCRWALSPWPAQMHHATCTKPIDKEVGGFSERRCASEVAELKPSCQAGLANVTPAAAPVPCRWVVQRQLHIPPSADFSDYSGMSRRGDRIGIISQVCWQWHLNTVCRMATRLICSTHWLMRVV